MKPSVIRLGRLLIIAAVLLLGAVPVTAAEKTEFPCTETFYALVDPGTMAFPGGNIHLRGMVQIFREDAPDPRNIGYNTVVINANWRPDGTGPMWGTFHLMTDEGGVWDGTWNGMVTAEGTSYHAVGKGTGLYAGMKNWVDVNNGVCLVRILEH